MATSSASEIGATGSRVAPLSRSAWSWAAYQGGRDTYVIIIGTYIFIPYVTTAVVGDPVQGQALLALVHLVSGLIVAFTAPLLGAAVDQMRARKPWLVGFTILAAPLIALLWWAAPGGSVLPVPLVIAMLTLIGICLSYGEVVYGAMLTDAATPDEQPRASGLALTLGNFVSVVLMIGLLLLFVLPGHVTSALVPAQPLFGLGSVSHGADRLTAPLVALCLVIGTMILVRGAKDEPSTGVRLGAAIRRGAVDLRHLFSARLPRDPMLYLLARMLYVDGKMALLIFGGVYAAGVMGWGATELLTLGLLVTVAGVAGGVFGGWLDTRIGPRRALAVEIAVTLVCAVAQLGITPGEVLFLWHTTPGAPTWNVPIFASAPEVAYVALAVVLSVFGTASWASSRTLMTRLAPPEHMGIFFGLYGLSGTLTIWVAPLAIEIVTRTFASQRAGLVPVSVLMLAGLVLLMFVRGGGRLYAHEGTSR